MSTQKPTFRVMKNGYDRFAVDDAIDQYAQQIEQLQKKLSLYQQQLVETTRTLEDMKQRYQQILTTEQSRQEAADNIARLSLREANEIISTAQKNADEIIREAISTARLILIDLTKLYSQATDVKGDMKKQLEQLLQQLDDFRIPQMPDMRWLEDAESKLR
ncbi:DivIVA domain-containing protein [Erysipelotrichaceae bacterium]|jgi:cell division initiation protein|uniref:DivIVA domain-containing protein n=1 Tax=unclassified Bulleidia TaxID=2704656 RepID=UPI0015B68610|nr:cell division protein DivIVA [Erysipelotrichaceae bacterium 7770_A6]MCI7724850.1 DivIVA domain-containing protein [Erysipelotrichaceae bacterium]MDY3660029.1 DivIVA domain-containing protein [Bulleidia sp.]MDD7058868.1 DivIVA domain-containing protein [Erysipelotrichaceae bacterium]MEE0558040.1 DivIVA domain-containing protein [Bulleidia sp.]